VQLGHLKGSKSPLVAVVDDVAHSIGAVFSNLQSLDDLIDGGPALWQAVEAAVPDLPTVSVSGWAAPLTRPSKVICVGLNYLDHAVEQGLEPPVTPLIFAKFPSSIIGAQDPIAWPANLTTQVDYEAELAVIVGTTLRAVDEKTAARSVFGYTAANDVSARDLQVADGQFVRAKSLDSFLPLGPTVVTPDTFGDPAAKQIATRLNGVIVQDSDTSQLLFGIPTLLSFLSQHMTLCPGDILLTGTPGGVGASRTPPRFMVPGDRVEVEIEGIGVLSNPIADWLADASPTP
jgi:5-carboxymethyl-2-hydroxymuconate isomerase